MRKAACSAFLASVLVASLASTPAQADEPKPLPSSPAPPAPMPIAPESAPGTSGAISGSLTPEQVHLQSDTETPVSTLPEAPLEAPPPPPRRKGVVAEASIGALGFLGQFRHVAPTAPWYHMQVGYEVTRWLMLFGEGELAFTSTDVAQDESHSYAFPIFGFGGGARVTVHPTYRVALYVQGSIDGMKGDVPTGALDVLGYRNAESIAPAFGARLGVEWYQVDRHLALGLAVGGRDATGFAKQTAKSDTGLMADASAVIRYTF
jgi:hypothetical protein